MNIILCKNQHHLGTMKISKSTAFKIFVDYAATLLSFLYSKSANSLPPRPPLNPPRKPRGALKGPLVFPRPLPDRKPPDPALPPLPLNPRPRFGRSGIPNVSAFSLLSSAQFGLRSLKDAEVTRCYCFKLRAISLLKRMPGLLSKMKSKNCITPYRLSNL
uniref:Uncharacterized protein n=1 Tax=Micrurus corallinus TaxID=54390 RepID=A0A2D4FRF8_MICCO